MYEERKYRSYFKGDNLVFFDVCAGETDLRIGACTNLTDIAVNAVIKYRQQIEGYIRMYPEFFKSLIPVEVYPGASLIIKKMCNAAQTAGVGPMAAVAGAVSEMVGLELLKCSEEVVVENGGDIFIKTNLTRKVGIYAGKSPLSEKLAIEILPERTPVGICTSSGTVGHSLSFGKADAAVIISKDTFLADTAATATGNLVKSMADIDRAIEFASKITGVEGVLIIAGDRMGVWGNIKLVGM